MSLELDRNSMGSSLNTIIECFGYSLPDFGLPIDIAVEALLYLLWIFSPKLD